MKKILISIVAVVLILYTGAWFFVASKIRGEFDNVISENNLDLKYKEISVSGYPFDFKIILREPTYRFSDSRLANFMMKVDGDIYFSAGLFATKLTLSSNGPWTLKGYLNNYNFKIKAEADEDTSYVLQLKSSPLSKNFISNILDIKKEPLKIFNVVDYLRVNGKGLSVYNHSSQSNLLKIKRYNVKLGLEESGKNLYEVSIEDNLINAVFGPEVMNLWDNAKAAYPVIEKPFSSLKGNTKNYFRVLNLSERGKINHEIDAKYISSFSSKDPQFELDINKFYIKDLLTSVDAKGTVDYKHKSFGPDFNANMKIEGKFTDKWYELSNKYAKKYNGNLFNFLTISDSGSSSFLNAFNNIFTPKSSKNASFVPKLQDLGMIKINSKVNFKTISKGQFELGVSRMGLKTDKYSYVAKGDYAEKSEDQKYNFDLEIDRYNVFIDDCLDYIKQVGSGQMILMLLGKGKFDITPQTRNEIKEFLKEVSNDPNSSSEDISYTIRKKFGEKYPAVGKYSSREFGSKWRTFKLKIMANEIQNTLQDLVPNKTHKKIGKAFDLLGDFGSGLLSK